MKTGKASQLCAAINRVNPNKATDLLTEKRENIGGGRLEQQKRTVLLDIPPLN